MVKIQKNKTTKYLIKNKNSTHKNYKIQLQNGGAGNAMNHGISNNSGDAPIKYMSFTEFKALIESNKKLFNEKTLNSFNTINMFYDVYYQRKSECN